MKGLLFALRLSASDSLRGIGKWTDIFSGFSNGFPPLGLAVAGVAPPKLQLPTYSPEIEDKKSEGFVWGVPKKRRSVEVRLSRKFGAREWVWKMLIPKYNLLICDNCGHHYQAKHLCRNCYDKTVEATKEIRDKIQTHFGDNAVDKEVVVLYDSDKPKGSSSSHDIVSDLEQRSSKLIIEIPKGRPTFFSPNLLQKSTVGINRKVKDVTTTDPVPIVHKS